MAKNQNQNQSEVKTIDNFKKMSYSELLEQMREIQALAAEKRQEEIAPEIARIRASMETLGLTAADLGFKVAKGKSRGEVAPKYRNPLTGETWTGRGLAPKWIIREEASGKNRSEFLIK